MDMDRARRIFDVTAACLGLAFSAFVVADAMASDRARDTPLAPAYVEECGGCHVPYAPRLLSAAAWERILAELDRHFGVDARIDATMAATLRPYLAAQAAPAGSKRGDSATTRITQTRWFVREHRGIAPATWRSADVQSAGNCAACHPQAAQGVFDEHAVRVPRG